MAKRPNFLVILADDLGFSDVGCYGGEIQTPNIDALASEAAGTRFTNYHVASMCSPTRSMLMTGTDNHIAGLGSLAELIRASPAHQGKPGHEGHLNDRVVALPELLTDGGYYTVMAGKWHLGLKKQYSPQARGFKRSFALLPGAANHYGYEPQYQDPINEPGPFFDSVVTALHMEDSEYVPELPSDFYSSDYYGTKLIDYLSNRAPEDEGKPFFAYLPFSAPHWPLQAPKESIDKYRGFYDDGPAALRLRRLESLKKLGLIDPSIKPHDVVTVPGDPAEWEDMDAATRAKSARAMEAYAGMVDRMDWNIGRVISHLKETGEYDNTYIIFQSDNGAEGASIEARPVLGDKILEHLARYYDNSLANIGNRDSFVWYGTRWAQAATAPSRLHKRFSTEGGCRVPLILKPAAGPATSTPPAPGGKICHAFCSVMDVVPTFLELAGLQHPGAEYKGRQLAPLRGASWARFIDTLRANPDTLVKEALHPDDYVMGFEVAGSAGLIKGRHKLTYVPFPKGPQRWELFDLKEDPGETRDLREERPQLYEELLGEWERYKKEVGVVGLAGELDGIAADEDKFEDSTQWTRWIGKKDIPPELVGKVPS
ncbi:arylsulfatase [Phyllosticta capitalensis]